MITPTQLAARRKHIGSSDAAAILGLDPYRSAYDVWLEKTADIEPDTSSEAAEVGNWIEPLLCRWAEERINEAVMLSPPTYVGACEILAANVDAIEAATLSPTFFVEAKSTGIASDWGDENTDQVPARVVTQTAVAFACVPSLRVAWIPVLLGNFGLRRKLYRVERDDSLVDAVANQCRAFWTNHVLTGKPPEGTAPNLDLLARIRREPGSWADLGDDSAAMLNEWEEAKALAKGFEAKADECKARLIAALGNAEGARLPDGRKITYLQQTRKEHVAKASTFRVLRSGKDQTQ